MQLNGAGSVPIRSSLINALSSKTDVVWLFPEPYEYVSVEAHAKGAPRTWTPHTSALKGVFMLM